MLQNIVLYTKIFCLCSGMKQGCTCLVYAYRTNQTMPEMFNINMPPDSIQTIYVNTNFENFFKKTKMPVTTASTAKKTKTKQPPKNAKAFSCNNDSFLFSEGKESFIATEINVQTLECTSMERVVYSLHKV